MKRYHNVVVLAAVFVLAFAPGVLAAREINIPYRAERLLAKDAPPETGNALSLGFLGEGLQTFRLKTYLSAHQRGISMNLCKDMGLDLSEGQAVFTTYRIVEERRAIRQVPVQVITLSAGQLAIADQWLGWWTEWNDGQLATVQSCLQSISQEDFWERLIDSIEQPEKIRRPMQESQQ